MVNQMTEDSRTVIDYAVKSSMPAPSKAGEGEPSYDSHQRSRGAVVSIQYDEENSLADVYLGNGRFVGSYEADEEGVHLLDRMNIDSFKQRNRDNFGEPGEVGTMSLQVENGSPEDYTLREVLEQTIGSEASEEVMSQVGVEDAQLNGVYRGMTQEGDEPGRRTSMPVLETQEYIGEEVDVEGMTGDVEIGDVEFDEYGQIDD
jgi:hypothetical protein